MKTSSFQTNIIEDVVYSVLKKAYKLNKKMKLVTYQNFQNGPRSNPIYHLKIVVIISDFVVSLTIRLKRCNESIKFLVTNT